MRALEEHLVDLIDKFESLDDHYKNDNCPITDCQVKYLKLIDQEGPLTTSQISKICNISKPTTSKIISRFLQEGYIEKESDPYDKRVYRVSITEKGKKITRADLLARVEVVRYIGTTLNETELYQLIYLMEKFLDS